MRRVFVYIDGFNLYHSIKELGNPCYKWLDLKVLSEQFINPTSESIEKIYYFSALATHMRDEETVTRHKAYIHALEPQGVLFIAGNFKKKYHSLNNKIKRQFRIPDDVKNINHEEKETDVNIAIYLVRDAIKNNYDKALVITNDTDIAPAIRMARTENPIARITVLTPPLKEGKSYIHDDLKNATGQPHTMRISKSKIEHSLFPFEIRKANDKIIRIPDKWLCDMNRKEELCNRMNCPTSL